MGRDNLRFMNSRVTGCASLSEVNSGSIKPGLISEAAIASKFLFSRLVKVETNAAST